MEENTTPVNPRPIDNVTTTTLDAALRVVGIHIDLCVVDKIIDIVELLEEKGDQTTLKDLATLEAEWNINSKT